MTSIALEDRNYCQTHDIFNCWLAHATAGWNQSDIVDPAADVNAPTVTPAELVAAADALRGESYVEGDNGAQYTLVGVAGPRVFYVRSRYGLLARVVVTSRHAWLPEQRVKITFGRDHGRADGAVTFDGVSVGGMGWLAALERVGVTVDV